MAYCHFCSNKFHVFISILKVLFSFFIFFYSLRSMWISPELTARCCESISLTWKFMSSMSSSEPCLHLEVFIYIIWIHLLPGGVILITPCDSKYFPSFSFMASTWNSVASSYSIRTTFLESSYSFLLIFVNWTTVFLEHLFLGLPCKMQIIINNTCY